MWEQLIKAINDGNIKSAEKLISNLTQHELSKIDSQGNTALILAVQKLQIRIAEMLINKMSDEAINSVNKKYGESALTYAIREDLDVVTKILIKRMASDTLNITDNKGKNTLLMMAAYKGSEEITGMLLDKMSDEVINSCDIFGNTALTFAVYKNHGKVAKMLIEGMNEEAIKAVNIQGYSALRLAIKSGNKKIISLLEDKLQLGSNNELNVPKDYSETEDKIQSEEETPSITKVIIKSGNMAVKKVQVITGNSYGTNLGDSSALNLEHKIMLVNVEQNNPEGFNPHNDFKVSSIGEDDNINTDLK